MAPKSNRKSAPLNLGLALKPSTSEIGSSTEKRRGLSVVSKSVAESGSDRSNTLSNSLVPKDLSLEASPLRKSGEYLRSTAGFRSLQVQNKEQGPKEDSSESAEKLSGIKLKFSFGPLDDDIKAGSKAAGSSPRRSSLVKAESLPKSRNTPVRFTSPVVSAEYYISLDGLTGLATSSHQSVEAISLKSSRPTTETESPIQNSSELNETKQKLSTRKFLKKKRKESPSNMSNDQTPSSALQAHPSQQQRYPTYESFTSIPPQLFDIIPRTERLLSRILVPDQGIGAAAILDYESTVPEHKRPLDIKDLDSAANGVMVQIQRARVAVTALPGVDRTVEEQEEEIEWLESRVEKQREMLKNLRELMATEGENNGEK